MGGVDKAYQLMSSLKPRLRCRRTWMPLWLHSLDVARINSYIIAKEKKIYDNQKDFVCDWILALNRRAKFAESQRTRQAFASLNTPTSSSKKKRIRMSSTKPKLPQYRLQGERSDHVKVVTKEQQGCTYCKYERAMAKINGTLPIPPLARPSRKCLTCGDHLCSLHFDLFHTAEDSST